MTTEDFITDLFDRVDTQMYTIPKHSHAHLYPSEVVTLALLFAIKGVGTRAFYRWIVRDWLDPNEPVCFACSKPIDIGPTTSWPSLPSWAL